MTGKTTRKSTPSHSRQKQSFSKKHQIIANMTLLPLVTVCGIAVSAVMLFGNPTLWVSEEQSFALGFSENTDKEDYQFLLDASDSPASAAALVSRGEYRSISLDDTAGYSANIAVAAKTIDGYEIKPGETMSFNQVVGDVENNDAYQFAQEFDGYEEKSLRGAGISQVASALHIAALRADLEIAERHAFSVARDYAPLGFDAAVSFGVRDLKVKNISDSSLYVRATASGQTVEVKIYGEEPVPGTDVETISEIADSEKKPLSEVIQNPLATGDAELLTVASYRIYSEGGKEAGRELLSTDIYLVSSALS